MKRRGPAHVALGAAVVLFSAAKTGAETPRVEVDAGQRATVVGTFPSLEALVTQLCERAGVELRAYDAPDRTVSTSHEARPLGTLIERLLAEENYLVGVRHTAPPDPGVRVVWLHVTGAKRSGAESVPGPLPVPSQFGATDFDRERTADTNHAEQAVARALLANDERIAEFLRAEPAELARSLRQYPHIDALLRKVRDEQRHPAVVEKLGSVLDALAALDAEPQE